MKVFHQDRAPIKRVAAVGVLAASMLASVLGLAPAAHADVLYPDDCSADNVVTAVEQANLNPGPDIIVLEKKCTYEFDHAYFDPGLPGFTNSALPLITDDLQIVGKGAKLVSDAEHGESFRLLKNGDVFAGINPSLSMRDLTVSGFEIFESAGGLSDDDVTSGCLLNEGTGTMTLNKVTVKDCEVFVVDFLGATAIAGAIGSVGDLVLTSSTVSGSEVTAVSPNASLAFAGGIAAVGGNDGLKLSSSTVKGNSVTAASVTASTATAGGIAVYNGGEITMDKSTVSGNTATAKAAGNVLAAQASAGGILMADTAFVDEIARSTVTGNKASGKGDGSISTGGGILNVNTDGGYYGLAVDTALPFPFAGVADITSHASSDKTNITNNKASCQGGCIALGGGYANADLFGGLGATTVGEGIFTNTVFKGNVADGDDGVGVGGGLFLDGIGAGGVPGGGAETVLNNATVTKNSAKGDVWAAGGGIFTTDAANVNIDNSNISHNKPDDCFALTGTLFCDF